MGQPQIKSKSRRDVIVQAISAVLVLGLIGLLASMVGGCPTLQTEYGYSQAAKGRDSVNGVAGLRGMFASSGWETARAKRLSSRAYRYDAIVWFPTVGQAPRERAVAWMDAWLSDQPRTLVYVGYGYPTVEHLYWRQARPATDPEDRLEYRRREAKAMSDQSNIPFAVMAGGTATQTWACGWFTLESDSSFGRTSELNGQWASGIDPLAESLDHRLIVRPFDQKKDGGLIDTSEFPQRNIDFEPLLVDSNDQALVARVTCRSWPGSQVIVVNSAESLLNLSLLSPEHRAFSQHLVDACGDPGSVAFMRTDVFGARISGQDEDIAAGMELLTTWPLSMTTMHAVVLGFTVCMILLPIFGRPREIPQRSNADFADHITAVGELMQRAGDTGYARRAISDYFVKVRGDISGRWVIEGTPEPAATAAPKQARAVDSPSSGAESEAAANESSPAGKETLAAPEKPPVDAPFAAGDDRDAESQSTLETLTDTDVDESKGRPNPGESS